MANEKDKKYIVKTVTDKKLGKRIYFYGKTQREVNRKILEYTTKIEKGRIFQEVSDEWWEEKEPQISVTTVNNYKIAKKRADIEFGDMPIKDITRKDVDGFIKSLTKHGYAKKTVTHQRLVLNLIFKHAVYQGDIDNNPCYGVSIPNGLPEHKRTAATPKEEKQIADTADIWLFPYFALKTGMRKGEALAIQKKDIDIDNGQILVYKQVVYTTNAPTIKMQTKTKAGMRAAPLVDELKEKLLPILRKMKPEDYLFSDNGGKTPITKKRYDILYKHYKKAAGIDSTAHQLRHSFATHAFEVGVPVKSIQHIIGHKNISTTLDIYTDFREEALKEAIEKLNTASEKGSSKQ